MKNIHLRPVMLAAAFGVAMTLSQTPAQAAAAPGAESCYIAGAGGCKPPPLVIPEATADIWTALDAKLAEARAISNARDVRKFGDAGHAMEDVKTLLLAIPDHTTFSGGWRKKVKTEVLAAGDQAQAVIRIFGGNSTGRSGTERAALDKFDTLLAPVRAFYPNGTFAEPVEVKPVAQ